MNYAIPRGGPATNPWMAGLQASRAAVPGLDAGSKALFDTNRDAGLEWFLNFYNLGQGNKQGLRRLSNLLQARYDAQDLDNSNSLSSTRWMDWLAKQDFRQDLSATPRDFRGDSGARFGQAAKMIAF